MFMLPFVVNKDVYKTLSETSITNVHIRGSPRVSMCHKDASYAYDGFSDGFTKYIKLF